MTTVTASNQFKYRKIQATNHVNNKSDYNPAAMLNKSPLGNWVGGQMTQIAITEQVTTANNVKYVKQTV